MVKLERLALVRERKPMSKQELAKAAGISRAELARIEVGTVNPYPRTIRRLAQALQVEPEELY